MKIFKCIKCKNIMDGLPPRGCECGFIALVIDGVYQFTDDAPISAKGDGVKWLGYEQVGENYEPGYIHNKEADTIGGSRNLADFLGSGKMVLDIGAGMGASAISFALAGLKVIAADISQAMLKLAVKRAKQHGVPANQITFARMNGYKLAMDDNSVDAVLEVDMLQQVNLPEQVFEEILRVLKPNGCFLQYGGWSMASYTEKQQAANAYFCSAEKDLLDYYDKALCECGYAGRLFSSWEQAAKCKNKYLDLCTTLKNTGCYDVNNLIWTLDMGLHKTKTRASGAKQLIPDEVHEAAWAKTDAYAKNKYGNDYMSIKRYWNNRSGIAVYKIK